MNSLLPREGEKVAAKPSDEGVRFRMKSAVAANRVDAPSSGLSATFSPFVRGRRDFETHAEDTTNQCTMLIGVAAALWNDIRRRFDDET